MPWSIWPDATQVTIPILKDRAPFDQHSGLEAQDRRWRDRLARAILAGSLEFPHEDKPTTKQISAAIYGVALRSYHVARIVQCFFSNPNHGNYKDPFLETLFILLTWRARIEDAHQIIVELRTEFSGPRDILDPGSAGRLQAIVGKAGFSGKRPGMVVELVRRFVDRFPDGNTDVMSQWADDEVLTFLTSIPGVGRKSALCVIMYSLDRDRLPIDTHVRRVLRRTGLLRELYNEREPREHREFQAEAEQYIPPSVRRPLHTGLLSVGQEYCLSGNPLCDDCPLNNVCQYCRERQSKLAAKKRLVHVDLFSGAGGFGQGFEQDNFRTILAVDMNSHATRTYRLNHPDVPENNVLTLDLEKTTIAKVRTFMPQWGNLLTSGRVHVITAGIPCQGFSKAGYRTRPGVKYDVLKDPRNHLYKVVIKWTRELQPRYVVIENVPEMRTAGKDEKSILASVKAAFEKLGYFADFDVVDATDFGVAQKRQRLILIASHPGVAKVKLQDLECYYREPKNLKQVIGHLPAVEAAAGAWYMRVNGKIAMGHRARFNNQDDLEIFAAIQPGENYVAFTERCKDILEKRLNHSVRKVYSTDSFPDKFFKLKSDEPSRTIVAHLQRDGNGYIHPDQVRSITPLEAALIQGFDAGFAFTGSQGNQFAQIGNAVPPPLAGALARLLASKLKKGAK